MHTALSRRFEVKVAFEEAERSASAVMLLDFSCGAGISDWDGRLHAPGDRLTLERLKTLQAYADGKMTIFGDLIDDNGRVVQGTELRWSFEDELPLAALEPDLRSILSTQGPKAHVKLGMLDGVEAYWKIHQFEPAVVCDTRGYFSPVPIVAEGAEFCVRSLSAYANEKQLGTYSLSDGLGHQPVAIPASVHSPFLCYIRGGENILTRPVWIDTGTSSGIPCDRLAKAMLDGPFSQSLEEYVESLAATARPHSSSLEAMIRLIASLNGLPPRIFRVLELLPAHPKALLRTLGAAPPELRTTVLGLERGLPFSWF
ncbi:MAG: hypothetical protein ACK42I_10805, partial [Thermomicrobium sp.]